MKVIYSPFFSDVVKLDLMDIILLLIGRKIKSGAMVVSLWKSHDSKRFYERIMS